MSTIQELIGVKKIVNEIIHLLNPLFIPADSNETTDSTQNTKTISKPSNIMSIVSPTVKVSEMSEGLDSVPKCIAFIGQEHTGTTFMMQYIAEKLSTKLEIVDGSIMTSYDTCDKLKSIYDKVKNTSDNKMLVYIRNIDQLGGTLYDKTTKKTLSKLIEKNNNIVTFIKTDDDGSYLNDVEISLTIPYLSYDDRLCLLMNCFKSIKLSTDIDYALILKPMNNSYPPDIVKLCRKVKLYAKLTELENFTNSPNESNNINKQKQIISAEYFEKVLKFPCKKILKSKSITGTSRNDNNNDDSNDTEETEIKYDIIGLNSLRDNIMRYCEIIFDKEKPDTKLKQSLLVHGQDGIGKKKLILYISKKINIPIHTISGKEFTAYTNHDKTIENIFNIAQKNPCIIFVRDIHLAGDVRSILNGFNTIINKLDPHRLIIFTSAKPYEYRDIFPIQFSAKGPNNEERLEILKMYDFVENDTTANDVKNIDLNEIAVMTNDYVGNELNILCNITMMQSILDGKPVTTSALKDTLQIFEKKEINIESPNVKFSDISGLEEAKKIIEDIIIYPSLYPSICKEYDIPTSSGMMLYGEPGCGKTLLAKAIATECKSSFISVRGPELLSSYFGETEKQIRNLFEKAKQNSPCVIFFDEIDAIGKARGGKNAEISDRILTQLLTELDGMGGRDFINVIAATNRKDQLDPALLRSGRFDKHVYIASPNSDAMKNIIIHSMKKVNCDELNYEEFLPLIQGYSGADVVNLCNTSKQIAFREKIQNKLESNPVTHNHFMKAVQVLKQNDKQNNNQTFQ